MARKGPGRWLVQLWHRTCGDRGRVSPQQIAIEGPMLNRRQIAGALAAMAAAGSATQTGAHTAPGDPDNGSVWWSDLFTNNPAKAHAFYSKVFGWTPKIVALDDPSRAPKAGEKDYTLFTVGGRETA